LLQAALPLLLLLLQPTEMLLLLLAYAYNMGLAITRLQ
jgi:hypothetical protein